MSARICWKCSRSVEPLTRMEHDKKKKKWLIEYCPFERCAANLEILEAPRVKLWNGAFWEDDDAS